MEHKNQPDINIHCVDIHSKKKINLINTINQKEKTKDGEKKSFVSIETTNVINTYITEIHPTRYSLFV